MPKIEVANIFAASQDQIVIRKVAEPGGWLSNMSPHPIEFEEKRWWHAEALFQALRFSPDDVEAREAVREPRSPMKAKMIAKKYKALQVILPLSLQDVENMRLCLKLKLVAHPILKKQLIASGEKLIVEDCSSRGRRVNNLFWGALKIPDENSSLGYFWEGRNVLGQLWMELRGKL